VRQRSKLQNLKLQSTYTLGVHRVGSAADFGERSHTSPPRFADVQRVVSGTGAATFSLVKKQLESLGCPLWGEDAGPTPDGPASYGFTTCAIPSHLKLYFVTSDAAGDQCLARKVWTFQ
jgi:hypothetical protein